MAIKYQELVESYNAVAAQRDEETANKFVLEVFQKHEKPNHVDLGKLFEVCFGQRAVEKYRNNSSVSIRSVFEAAGATSTAAFTNITGQIVYSAILPKYEAPEFIFTKLIPTVPTKFNGEKIPGITRIGDAALVVGEGQPYPLTGVAETYITTPPTRKYGFRDAVTKEAVFFDRTGQLMDRLGEGAYFLGLSQEKRAIDCLIDENTNAISATAGGHRYRWRDVDIASYGDNSGTHTWDNLSASNALVDWTNLQTAWINMQALKDPDINEPINVQGRHLVVTPQLAPTAYRIKRTLTTRSHVGGYASSGNLNEFTSVNPVPEYFDFDIVSSQLLADRLATDTSWFYGDIARYARWMENWPIQSITAPAMSEDEFKLDIVFQSRVDLRGAFSVWDPRYINKSTA